MYKKFVKINFLFILIFLNIWDFLLTGAFFNAMVMGLVLFGPVAALWFWGVFRAVVVLTLVSILEFTLMAIFLVEGLELGGLASTLKSLFWLPYLVMAGLNGFWGLSIYYKYRESKSKMKGKRR